jgi:membrane-associated phospholipid phosphatase
MAVIARWISILAHPFVMVALLVASTIPPAEVPRSLALVTVAAILPVGVLMALQVRRGSWANVDASSQSERPVLFVVAAMGLVALLVSLFLLCPQSILLKGASAALTMLIISAVTSRWLKVSLHMAFASLATTTLLLLGSLIGAGLLLVLPLLAWSRLYLRRHSPSELVGGVIVGAATGFALYYL